MTIPATTPPLNTVVADAVGGFVGADVGLRFVTTGAATDTFIKAVTPFCEA